MAAATTTGLPPASSLTKDQRRRVEALQKARSVLSTHGPFSVGSVRAVDVITVADWILDGIVIVHDRPEPADEDGA